MHCLVICFNYNCIFNLMKNILSKDSNRMFGGKTYLLFKRIVFVNVL